MLHILLQGLDLLQQTVAFGSEVECQGLDIFRHASAFGVRREEGSMVGSMFSKDGAQPDQHAGLKMAEAGGDERG